MKRYMFFFIIIFFCLVSSVSANNKSVVDITELTMNEQIDYLDKGVITSYELVNLYLDRINTYNDTFKALITINPNILDEAKEMDELRQKGEIKGKLHGIPIIVKDNIDVLGMPTTAGAKALADNMPLSDAKVISLLKEKGAIILAKSNMSEFAIVASSSRSSYGTVKNAYNEDYSAYGSSGGSAVSIALSLASAALGTDTNSSVRVPASAASIVGFRPSLGLISKEGVLPYDPERDTVGPLTKNLKDTITILNIISETNYKLNLSNLEGITIGVPTNFLKGDNKNKLSENKETYKEIYNLMINAITKLEENGAKIVYIDEYYTYNEDYEVANSYSGFLFCDSFNSYIKNTTGTIQSFESLAKSSKIISNLDIY